MWKTVQRHIQWVKVTQIIWETGCENTYSNNNTFVLNTFTHASMTKIAVFISYQHYGERKKNAPKFRNLWTMDEM